VNDPELACYKGFSKTFSYSIFLPGTPVVRGFLCLVACQLCLWKDVWGGKENQDHEARIWLTELFEFYGEIAMTCKRPFEIKLEVLAEGNIPTLKQCTGHT